jgi:hypothetical protein
MICLSLCITSSQTLTRCLSTCTKAFALQYPISVQLRGGSLWHCVWSVAATAAEGRQSVATPRNYSHVICRQYPSNKRSPGGTACIRCRQQRAPDNTISTTQIGLILNNILSCAHSLACCESHGPDSGRSNAIHIHGQAGCQIRRSDSSRHCVIRCCSSDAVA